MIIEVTDGDRIAAVSSLAEEIWTEHYTPIIGRDQVRYMIAKFQSREAISAQIDTAGFMYFLIGEKGAYVGYIAVKPEKKELFLSKIYVKLSERGRGFGKMAMQFIENLARRMKLDRITLTVNRNNVKAIQAYERMGFRNLGQVVQDIGGGFVMDDFKMEKLVRPHSSSRILNGQSG